MSRLVTMGVVAVVFVVVCECCDAVCPRGQPPPSPSLGISPPSCQDHICPRPVGPPAPPLPSPSSLGDAHVRACTHTSYLSCVFYFLMFGVAHWLGVFTSGRGGGWFLGGGQRRAGNAWRGARGHHKPCSLQEQLLLPYPRVPVPPPKRWPLFTVRTRSLCLRFLKYKP